MGSPVHPQVDGDDAPDRSGHCLRLFGGGLDLFASGPTQHVVGGLLRLRAGDDQGLRVRLRKLSQPAM